MERQHEPDPNPRCPSPELAQWLRIPENILNLPRALMDYALRVPTIQGDNGLMAGIINPRTRLNLMPYLRRESLIHPLIMYREAAKREPYLGDNHDLRNWVTNSLRGQMTPKIVGNPLKTDRCSFCGSSFFGFPMTDHSINNCKLFQLLPKERHLDFVVANTLSFCGFCNSRSVRHDDCPQSDACTTCYMWGHKNYHGVCTRGNGPSREQFQTLVQELRISRARRIRWMVSQGLLGIPFPTDYIHPDLLDQLDIAEARRLTLIGAGPLKRPIAELFEKIPDAAYRWKSYDGIFSVELHPYARTPCVEFTVESANWFQILETRAREAFANRDPERHHCFILDFTYNIPRPIFPDHVYVPGRDRIINGHPVLLADLPPEVDGPALQPEAQEIVPRENDERIDQGIVPREDDGRIARREERVSPPGSPEESDDESIAIENEMPAPVAIPVWERLNPPELPLIVKERLDSLIDKSSFDEKVDKLFPEGKFEESVPNLSEREKERKLKELVQKEVENYSVLIGGKRYGIGINRAVVERVSRIGFPEDNWAIDLRILTWHLILTGVQDGTAMCFGPPELITDRYWRYSRYLMDTALALVDQPRCLTKIAYESADISSHMVKGIPYIEIFCDPEVRTSIMAWTAAERHHFSSFNVSKDSFSIQIATPRRSFQEKTADDELLEGQMLHMYVESSDQNPRQASIRLTPPTDEVLGQIVAAPIPARKESVVIQIGLIQQTIAGSQDDREVLRKGSLEILVQYAIFLRTFVQGFRCAIANGIQAPVFLTDCLTELYQGRTFSYMISLPTFGAYQTDQDDWWLIWIDQLVLPQLDRITRTKCQCILHQSAQPIKKQ